MSEVLAIKPEYKDKTIRSYVIRGGRITKAQKKAFECAWTRYGLSLFDGVINPSKLFARQAPLVLEVGFGMGDSLLAMAKDQPDTDFIGVEVHPPGVGCLLNNASKLELTNLRIYMADAVDVLRDCIPNNSLNRFQLYFPDPWHKKKHHKRRIVQAEFMQLVRQKLRLKGVCHLATDWQNYAEHMMTTMTRAEGFSNQAIKHLFSVRPNYRPFTKFEKRGQRLGHGVWDLIFYRND